MEDKQEFCEYATMKDDGNGSSIVTCSATGMECVHKGYHSKPFKSCLVYIALSRPAGFNAKKEIDEYMQNREKWIENTVEEREKSITEK